MEERKKRMIQYFFPVAVICIYQLTSMLDIAAPTLVITNHDPFKISILLKVKLIFMLAYSLTVIIQHQ
jgi:hypothetical protein